MLEDPPQLLMSAQKSVVMGIGHIMFEMMRIWSMEMDETILVLLNLDGNADMKLHQSAGKSPNQVSLKLLMRKELSL